MKQHEMVPNWDSHEAEASNWTIWFFRSNKFKANQFLSVFFIPNRLKLSRNILRTMQAKLNWSVNKEQESDCVQNKIFWPSWPSPTAWSWSWSQRFQNKVKRNWKIVLWSNATKISPRFSQGAAVGAFETFLELIFSPLTMIVIDF